MCGCANVADEGAGSLSFGGRRGSGSENGWCVLVAWKPIDYGFSWWLEGERRGRGEDGKKERRRGEGELMNGRTGL